MRPAALIAKYVAKRSLMSDYLFTVLITGARACTKNADNAFLVCVQCPRSTEYVGLNINRSPRKKIIKSILQSHPPAHISTACAVKINLRRL